MKLIFLLILFFIYIPMDLSAQDKSRNPILETKISLRISDETLNHVLHEINRKYQIEFSYSSNIIDVDKKVSILADEAQLENVLQLLLEGLPVTYSIIKNRIVFQKIKEALVKTIRGKLIDIGSKTPIAGATVIITDFDQTLGSVTDDDGLFKIENVPIGRQGLKISHISYEPFFLPSFLVVSGKENVFFIELTESSSILEEVVVFNQKKQSGYKHDVAVVSSNSLQIEEAKKYATSLNDPARMVSSAPGVAGDDFMENAIVIRGNSSRGLLWRIEGIDIPNPNHFAEEGDSGGGVSIINAYMLDNSHLLTGAFPARYGNALSGVLDLHFRNGNNERREYYVQAGTMGLDVAMEGPFVKGKPASYLMNYRYSSFSLLDKAGFSFSPSNTATRFQDVSFKINLPTNNSGEFSLFGIGGMSNYQIDSHNLAGEFQSKMGVLGLIHDLQINNSTSLRSSLSLSATEINQLQDFGQGNLSHYQYKENFSKTFARGSILLHKKLSPRHLLEAGVNYTELMYNFKDDIREEILNLPIRNFSYFNDKGNAALTQAYISWQSKTGKKWQFLNGMHFMYFDLNGKASLEPRIGISYQLLPRHNLNAAFGIHSRIEPLQYYFARFVTSDQNEIQYNRNLDFTKARHYVISYNYNIRHDMFFKLEAYYQDLYNIAISTDTTSVFSSIAVYESNIQIIEGFTSQKLFSQGTGTNYGIEASLEKSFSKDYYFNINGSLFNATYVTGNFLERNSPYNGSFATNLLTGKAFRVGSNKNENTINLNFRGVWRGGKRYVPINLIKSREANVEVSELSEAYKHQLDDYKRLDLQLVYRFNLPKYTGEWKLDIFNLTGQKNITQIYYDVESQDIRQNTQIGMFPVLSYKMEF